MEQQARIDEKIAQLGNYCYICHKRFSLLCGTPRVIIDGCCSGVIDKNTMIRYMRPVFAHFLCYASEPDKRRKTIISLNKLESWINKEEIRRENQAKKSQRKANKNTKA